LPDGVYFLFGGIQYSSGFARGFVHHFGDISRRFGKVPQHGVVFDNAGIFAGVSCCRRNFHQTADIRSQGIQVADTVNAQRIENCDGVYCFGIGVHRQNRLINVTVLLNIKISRFDFIDNFGQAAAVDQYRTDDRLFGF
jgi:hypothetical protein